MWKAIDGSEVVQGNEYFETNDTDREGDSENLISENDVSVRVHTISQRALEVFGVNRCSSRTAVATSLVVLIVVVVAVVATTLAANDPHYCHKEAVGSVWNECGMACVKTCSDPNPMCTRNCVPRCQCPQSKPLLLEGRCVEQTACSASDVTPPELSAAANAYWKSAGLIHGPGVGLQSHHEFRKQLQVVLKSHRVLTYGEDWKGLANVSYRRQCPPGSFYGVYSGYCWKTGKAAEGGSECGIYHHEGQCWNREHIWPKSWFGGFDEGHGAQTDLHELWAADGYVNGRRRNYPFCEVRDDEQASYTSSSGDRLGNCIEDGPRGYSGRGFEINETLKGDVARSYFYISSAYYGIFDCCDAPATNRSAIKPWQVELLRFWHALDPVSDEEREMNEAIFAWQGNRNPFVDFPDWVDRIDFSYAP